MPTGQHVPAEQLRLSAAQHRRHGLLSTTRATADCHSSGRMPLDTAGASLALLNARPMRAVELRLPAAESAWPVRLLPTAGTTADADTAAECGWRLVVEAVLRSAQYAGGISDRTAVL